MSRRKRLLWPIGAGLLGVTFLIMLTVTTVGVLALGVSRVRIHYMFLLYLFPIYFFARVQAAGTTDRAINFCATALLAFALIVPSAVVVKYFVDPLRKSKGYYHMPYADFAQQLKAAGFKKGTVIGDWLGYPLAGNLRPYFPESRFISLLDWQYIALVDHPPTPVLPPRASPPPNRSWSSTPADTPRSSPRSASPPPDEASSPSRTNRSAWSRLCTFWLRSCDVPAKRIVASR